MPANLSLDELIQYTDWERQRWFDRLRQSGDHALTFTAGPNGDGRFDRVGDLMRHIFSAEKRYIESVWSPVERHKRHADRPSRYAPSIQL